MTRDQFIEILEIFDRAEANDLTPSELRRRLTFVIQRGVRRKGQIDVLNENTQEATIGRNETVQRIFREVLASYFI